MQTSFKTARGADVRLEIGHNNEVVVFAGKLFGKYGQRIDHAQHGASIMVKVGTSETIIPIPVDALPAVDAIFAEAAARVAAWMASRAPARAANAAYDAHREAVTRLLNTSRTEG